VLRVAAGLPQVKVVDVGGHHLQDTHTEA
jgi:hypothetical protein